jgi:hypothetical protein
MSAVMQNEIIGKVSSAFNFTVDKFPLSGPDGMRTPWYGLFRSDTNAVVGSGSVTSRYVPHQTDDVLALVESAANAFEGAADVSCYFNHGHYVSIQPTKDYRISVYGQTDNVWPRVIINSSYNGKAFQATIGYYRDACRNLARIRSVKETFVNIRHTSGLRPKMQELIDSFGTLRNGWENLSQVIARMESTPINLANFLREVYGEPTSETGRGATVHRNRTEKIMRRIISERANTGRPPVGQDFIVSAWEAFNGIQGYTQWDASRKGASGLSQFGRAVSAMNDLSVHKAEELVMEAIAA